MKRHPIGYRPEEAVWFILDVVESDAVPWQELIEALRRPGAVTASIASKTLENILHEMVSFGYLYRTGNGGGKGRPDSRLVKVTEMGRSASLRHEGVSVVWPDPWSEDYYLSSG